MYNYLFILCLLTTAQGTPTSDKIMQTWVSFKQKYGKLYRNDTEDGLKLKAFVENNILISKHNLKYEKGEVRFKLGMNQFGDMTQKEFDDLMRFNMSSTRLYNNDKNTNVSELKNIELPDEIDWRTRGAVTSVKEQKDCDSCYAFSAIGAIEGQWFLKTGKLVDLSPQNLVDCSLQYHNKGCDGGLMTNAFQYVIQNGGISSESSYPYEHEVSSCRYNPDYKEASIKSCVSLPNNSEKIKISLGNIGPLSAAVFSLLPSFRFYKEGLYYDTECDKGVVNHAILLVGYGSSNFSDYWLVKNSWGTSWGEEGYMRLARNRNVTCGITQLVSYPVVD